VPSIDVTFKVIIQCELLSIDIAKSLPAQSTYLIALDPPLFLPFQLNEFPKCGLSYALSPVYDFVSYNATTGQIEVTSQNVLDEGTYDLKLTASPPQFGFGVSTEMFFRVIMINRCGNASIIPQKIPSIFAFKQDPAF